MVAHRRRPRAATAAPASGFSTFPDGDGEPVAENRDNVVQMSNLIYTCGHYLKPRTCYAVGGNQFIYYGRDNGNRRVSPTCTSPWTWRPAPA